MLSVGSTFFFSGLQLYEGLAVLIAIVIGTVLGALHCILFKNAGAQEDVTKLDVIVFDKTGTLTMRQPRVAAAALRVERRNFEASSGQDLRGRLDQYWSGVIDKP